MRSDRAPHRCHTPRHRYTGSGQAVAQAACWKCRRPAEAVANLAPHSLHSTGPSGRAGPTAAEPSVSLAAAPALPARDSSVLPSSVVDDVLVDAMVVVHAAYCLPPLTPSTPAASCS